MQTTHIFPPSCLLIERDFIRADEQLLARQSGTEWRRYTTRTGCWMQVAMLAAAIAFQIVR